MNIIIKEYYASNVKFQFEVEEADINTYIIPIDMPSEHFSKSHIQGELMMVPKSNFEEDMQQLIPNSIGKDFLHDVLLCLQRTVHKHMIEFGRILASDLKTYVGESVLIVRGLSIALTNVELDIELRQRIFVYLYKGVVELLDNK
ncbi:hypothetical protein QWY31_09505 [Cytophagales bacterium LB-30]|uniref:DUF1795 domain-containing protein n=1 Tax=Shiella aurantiaca TaxID=3058365 RepID=A0ABT8F606_9BACT|nr:hypothetical protein [Shiella aurantiaca]MDN4165738.1 hypothetical protein [Shiella aurantiaca]